MYKNLPDETVFAITRMLYTEFEDEEKETRLDEGNLKEFKRKFIKPLYPHKEIKSANNEVTVQKYSCGEFCCDLDQGSFFCFSAEPPGREYKDFGLGVCLYVKFLRHLTMFLLVASIFAVISVLIYYFVADRIEYPLYQTYENFIAGSTIGVVSSSYSKCKFANLVSNKAEFSLSCPSSGRINLLGPVYTNQTLNDIHQCRVEYQKFTESALIPEHSKQLNCDQSQESCNLTVTVESSTHESIDYRFLSYVYQCQDSTFELGSIQLNSSIVLYITIGIDLGILIAFLFFLASERQCEKDEQYNFKLSELAINDFTVKIKGFRVKSIEEDINELIRIQSQAGWKQKIVQIKVPETEELRTSIEKRRKKYLQLYSLIDSSFFEQYLDVRKYQTHEQFITKCYNSSNTQQYQKYKSDLEKALSDFYDHYQLQFSDSQTNQQKIEAYFIMNSPKAKIELIKSGVESCFSTYLKVDQRKYEICEPPFAEMIIWKNKYKWTFWRVILIWLLTLSICFGSYMLVGFAQFKRVELADSNNFNQDCSLFYSESDLQDFNEAKASDTAYVNCFCKTQFFSLNFDDQSTDCSEWIQSFSIYQSTPLLISFGIVVYNLLVSRFFRAMTKLQAHSYLTAELYSYIMKRSFLLIMNMGLILILLNINYNGSWDNKDFSFLFQGAYEDVTTDWFNSIGAAIILTLSFNIFLPILEMMLLSVLKCLRRCWDRRCFTRITSSKTKKQFLALYAGDLFPIEERYADLISIIAIVLAFSPVMPILYIIGFLSFAFMMLSDKVLLFRVYQKPLNYSSCLQSKVLKTVFVLLILHCAAAVLIISEQTLVQAAQTPQFISIDTGVERLNPIIEMPYIIPYVVILVVLVVWAVFKMTLIGFLQFCTQKCDRKPFDGKQSRQKRNTLFFDTLSSYQISRLKLSLQKQISSSPTRINEHTQMNISGSQSKNCTQIIAERTFTKLQQYEQQYDPSSSLKTVKLIGRAGYEEMFDDQALYREQKIRSLSRELNTIIKHSKFEQKQRQTNNLPIAESEIEITFN